LNYAHLEFSPLQDRLAQLLSETWHIEDLAEWYGWDVAANVRWDELRYNWNSVSYQAKIDKVYLQEVEQLK
jgi:hypothetical protein